MTNTDVNLILVRHVELIFDDFADLCTNMMEYGIDESTGDTLKRP